MQASFPTQGVALDICSSILGCLDAWITGRMKRIQAERPASWRAYLKEMWATSPKKIYKWIRGTAAVWDLAILSENGFALSPHQAAQAELDAWSKLWQPGHTTFPHKDTSQSSWRTGDLKAVISHCPLGKARGVDRWSIAELWILPDQAIEDLANFLKLSKRCYTCNCPRKELDSARDASERRPIALLPQARCTGRGEVPVGRGALDETFDLAFDTEKITAAGKQQAGVFLDCSKCYERIPLQTLEAFALESGYPLYALYAALDMYAGRRSVLRQGAVSEPVTAIHGMPPGCGHAVDLLHAFLLMTLKSAGRHVSVRKYVDDMVLEASGPCFARHLCYGYQQVHKSLTKANMKVNLKKTVVICNGANAKRLLMKVWRAGRLPPPRVTTRDLGVDTQWAAWRCPVQRKRLITFKQSMDRVRSLGLPATSKARIAKSLCSVGLYGAEV
eukprot:6491558-Amphidinium_carterae.2